MDQKRLGLVGKPHIMPAMSTIPFELRDLIKHKRIDIIGKVVFVDKKHQEYRVSVDEDMPVEHWCFSEVELHQKSSAS